MPFCALYVRCGKEDEVGLEEVFHLASRRDIWIYPEICIEQWLHPPSMYHLDMQGRRYTRDTPHPYFLQDYAPPLAYIDFRPSAPISASQIESSSRCTGGCTFRSRGVSVQIRGSI